LIDLVRLLAVKKIPHQLEKAGMLGILGFASGWAITQAITGLTIPDDQRKGIIDMAGGLVTGVTFAVLTLSNVLQLQVAPQRIKR
jgi:hypothetical protein